MPPTRIEVMQDGYVIQVHPYAKLSKVQAWAQRENRRLKRAGSASLVSLYYK